MNIGALTIDGNVIEIALLLCLAALLASTFLIGRLYGLNQREAEQMAVESLKVVRAEQEQRIAELRKQHEAIFSEGIRARQNIERSEQIGQDHEALEQMRKELDEFEREKAQRIDELDRIRAGKERRLGEIEAALATYPPQIAENDNSWHEILAARKEEFDRLREQSVEALKLAGVEQEKRNAELRGQQEDIIREGLRAQNFIDSLQEFQRNHDSLDQMRKELGEFERERSLRIEELERSKAEKERRLNEIEFALASYPPQITEKDSTWNDFLADRKEEFDRLREKIEIAGQESAEIETRRAQAANEAARLESQTVRMTEELRAAEELLENIKQDQVGVLKPHNERLLDELGQLQDDIEEARQELGAIEVNIEEKKEEILAQNAKREAIEAVSGATIAFPDDALAVSVKELPSASDDKPEGDKLSAFRMMPACLREYAEIRSETDEEGLLDDFEQALKNSGLRYPRQIIRAFHTALKVNDLSPLTVLSGLSGTGKSQLPKVYARFFGIHFLHVPVEPGWDSPQDLLGFYDFVAERYRPTDRARALGHFDSHFADEIGLQQDRDWENRMLIILLDEMNLARTEYYFSEFLSRLEMRDPRKSDIGKMTRRSDAQIAIDLPYAEHEKPKHLYVPHNVLWVGTLNEDESTQALSDKVLDRANSIRFAPPEPETLRKHSQAPTSSVKPADGYLTYSRWLQWSERETTNAGSAQVNETIGELAKLMKAAGRGFGYRIAQSISAYIDRYPGQDWRVPMIDQINMRLLPKLAGTELQDCQESLEEIIKLCEESLGSPEFSKALNNAITASSVSQIFTWPGYTYEEAIN